MTTTLATKADLQLLRQELTSLIDSRFSDFRQVMFAALKLT